ncbi:hypothetical protein AB0M39_19565 [Streptomyces sp. NPDC051907]|uniref:hypothetical protein n=1 Tax=Streptomyces sp. NPDC051907 TaxID=3155284 RepID=UPI0034307B04
MVPVRQPRTTAWAAAAVLVLLPAAAACSDDGGSGSASSPTPTATAPATPTTGAAPTGDGPADPAAAEQEVRENWTTFFDPDASTEDKVAVLEKGESLRPLLAAFGGDRNAAQTSVEVTDVQFTSPTQATVTYDLLVGGAPALPDSKGAAIFEDETWKVSVKSLCALVKLSGDAAPPGC